jgi:hypothetical protein
MQCNLRTLFLSRYSVIDEIPVDLRYELENVGRIGNVVRDTYFEQVSSK